jgi:hypothetical protein
MLLRPRPRAHAGGDNGPPPSTDARVGPFSRGLLRTCGPKLLLGRRQRIGLAGLVSIESTVISFSISEVLLQ